MRENDEDYKKAREEIDRIFQEYKQKRKQKLLSVKVIDDEGAEIPSLSWNLTDFDKTFLAECGIKAE